MGRTKKGVEGWRVACDLEEHSPDARPEEEAAGVLGAAGELVTAGVKLTHRYLYLPVIGRTEQLIWRCNCTVTSRTDTTSCW